MDLLLGNFVKKYIDEFNDLELKNLEKLLFIDDEVIYKWYFKNGLDKSIPNTKVSTMLKNIIIVSIFILSISLGKDVRNENFIHSQSYIGLY